MIKESDVTIVIPHLGADDCQERSLDLCMQSLNGFKRIVTINGVSCVNHTGDIVVKEQGQCKAVNAAVATVSTPWVLVTNDDMIYPPGWFDKINPIIENISCVSPKLIEPRPGSPTFEVYFCGGAGGDFNKDKFLDFAQNYKGTGLRTGFNMPLLIKKELWETIGGYDINYDPWGSNSDSDLEYKIKLAGVQPYQNTNCIVYHFSQTSGTFEPKNQPYWQKNWDYFIEKWGFPRTDEGIWEASFNIPVDRKFNPWWESFYEEAC